MGEAPANCEDLKVLLKHYPSENMVLWPVDIGACTSCSGVGIDPHTLPDLFKKFSRAAGANRVNATGTGLDLSVARQLVEAHGGSIWVESSGLGKGSTFFVRIPAA